MVALFQGGKSQEGGPLLEKLGFPGRDCFIAGKSLTARRKTKKKKQKKGGPSWEKKPLFPGGNGSPFFYLLPAAYHRQQCD